MYNKIYALPLNWYAVFALAALFVWATVPRLLAGKEKGLRHWRVANTVLFLLSLYFILWMALLRRTPGASERRVFTELFQSIRLIHIQPEQRRQIMLNILVFLPLGLSMSAALPERLSKALRMALTVVFCLLLSVLIEALQYYLAMGTTEVDDVVYNTFGALLGTLPLLLVKTDKKASP